MDSLSFSLYPNNQGYDKVFELSTKVKVIDLRDNTIRFSGRILNIDDKMDSDGKIYKDISCEGALSYLNDTKQRGSSYYADTVSGFLNQILSNHNSKVEAGKQILVGNVDVAGNVIHSCNYKTTLAEILEVRETNGGNIRIRETNGLLYMDWLQSFDNSLVEVSLGVNMKDMIISKDITTLGTRIIPLGTNNITIETVNNGYDYIEEANAKALYGVIEKTVEYKDITDPTILKNTCISDLPKHTQAFYVLKSNALDLSFISGIEEYQFKLGKKLNLINQYFGVNDIYSIVAMDLDLLTPYNPTLTIANRPITMSSAINDLRKSSLQNNGIYNNVQIGSDFGIRAVRSDNKVITTINATEGISIENNTKKVFYVDINGNLVCNDITANNGTYNNITAEGGNFNNITATGGLLIKDGEVASCNVNGTGIHLVGENGKTANIEILDDVDYSGTYIRDDLYIEDVLRVFGETVLEKYVNIKGDVRMNGEIRVGPDGYSLSDYIDSRIVELVKEDSLKPV